MNTCTTRIWIFQLLGIISYADTVDHVPDEVLNCARQFNGMTWKKNRRCKDDIYTDETTLNYYFSRAIQ